MATQKKITQLTPATQANFTDLLEKVNDPSGTPASQKVTLQQIFDLFKVTVRDSVPVKGDDDQTYFIRIRVEQGAEGPVPTIDIQTS